MVSSLKILCQNKALSKQRHPLPRPLVLASTARYRRELLERLGVAFECAAPQADESPLAGETAGATALRLAEAKARAVALRFPQALVIGADQVASCDGQRLDKPGNHANAVRQLTAMSGKSARFDTAVVVFDAQSGKLAARLVGCTVTFRTLSASLIERIETEDPTSLIGLPLIALTELLADAGAPVLG